MDLVNLLFNWDWCAQDGVRGVFQLVRSLINILRYVVPIGLIVMTSIDVMNKVINPEDKEGQKKLMTRAIAAVIVFFIPLFIQLVFRVIDWGSGRDGSYADSESGLSRCWGGNK